LCGIERLALATKIFWLWMRVIPRHFNDENLTDQRKKKMNRHMIPLGHIRSIPIGWDYCWFLYFVLITRTMVVGYYLDEFKNLPM
jgi:hypothetical protein